MINNDNSGDSDFLAHSRASMKSAPQSANPFRAGLDRGMANWRESQEQWATTISVPKVAACPACTKQISTSIANCLHCGEPLSKKLWQQIMAKQEAKSAIKTLCGVAAFALVGFYIYSLPETPLSPEDISRHRDELLASPAVYPCDGAARNLLSNSGSFDSQWGFGFRVAGPTAMIYRDFTAQNGFGATIDQHYICTFDLNSKTVTNVEFRNGFKP